MLMEGHAAAASPLPLPPCRQGHDTYIVQFPKNQVYRVPPRENALIVEQHRNPTAANKRRGGCCCCCSRRLLLTLALIVVSAVAIVGITLATLYFILNPAGPTFTVSNFVARNDKNSRAQYEVSLRAKNPNEKLGIEYEDGDVSLLFEETKVAAGKFPALRQGRDESSAVKVELTGSKGIKGGNTPVGLKLEMKLGVKITTAGLRAWVMRSNVVCEFKVSGLSRNDTRLLSQECDTKFRQY